MGVTSSSLLIIFPSDFFGKHFDFWKFSQDSKEPIDEERSEAVSIKETAKEVIIPA